MAVRLAPDQALVETFTRGIVRDSAPPLIPAGAVYDSADILFDRPGVAYKRGGSSVHSDSCGAAVRGQTIAILDPPNRIVMVCDDEVLYDVTSENSPSSTTVGTVGFGTNENPPLFVGRIILTDTNAQFSGLGVAPKKVYFDDPDVALANLGGSPPVAYRSCVHNGQLLLARNFDNPNTIWPSPLPDPEGTWDPDNSYFNVSYEIVAMASFQGVLFVFSSHVVERILGDISPSIIDSVAVTSNWALQPHAHIGCSDARSVVVTDQGVVFANADGVYIASSGGVTSLTERDDGTGISTYWHSLFSSVDGRGISCGMLNRDTLIVNVFTDAALIAGLILHLPTGAWGRVTNVWGPCYASGNSRNNTPYPELYVALGDAPKSATLSTFLLPSATTKNDSDGAAVLPFLRTRPLGTGPLLKAYGDANLTYDMRDSAADNPTLAVTVDRGLLAATTKTPAESPLAETTQVTRKGFGINCDSNDVALEFQQTGASSKTELYWLEANVRAYDVDSEAQ